MNLRENSMAILHYLSFEKMPVVAFGYWDETLYKWAQEGHISKDEADGYKHFGDSGEADTSVMKKLGFDFNWNNCFGFENDLFPRFSTEILEEKEDGSKIIRDENGLIVLIKPGVVSIPAEIGTSLMDRSSWKELYLPKLKWSQNRINGQALQQLVDDSDRDIPLGIHCGSLMGVVRNMLGVEQMSYLFCDDEELFIEIIDVVANLSYNNLKTALSTGAKFDYAHYWEDICFKNGPLIMPSVFDELVGPHYKRNSDLLNSYGIDIISVDCDGKIDSLIDTWLNNDVNTMFPIEVGTWDASLIPWREKYGKKIRGVGGMNKNVFALDYKAVDAEIERLKNIMLRGGYIPCPDHRIPPDAIFENVQYYCDKMQKLNL